MITERDWIGLSIKDAIQKANSINYSYRIVEEDGNALMVTFDYYSNRVNLRLQNNLVIGVYTG